MSDDIMAQLRERAETWLEGNEGDADLDRAAADEILRLRGQLENVQRDRMAQVEVERLRAERDYLRHELNNETDRYMAMKETNSGHVVEIERLRAELDRVMPVLNSLLDGN